MRALILVSTVFLIASTGIAPAATTAVTVTPSSGPPGYTTAVTGSAFAAREAVDVYFDTVDKQLLVSSAAGAISGSVIVPASASPGMHYITAIGRKSGDAAQFGVYVATPWVEHGFGPAHLGWNFYENTITTSNVASLGEVWTQATSSTGATSAISGGRDIVTGTTGISAFNSVTGALEWKALTTQTFYGSPAVSGNSVYIGSDSAAAFYALNAANGTMLWSTTVSEGVFSSATVVGGTVYFGGEDGTFYALQASTGKILWTYSTGGEIDGSPAVVDGVVYFGSMNGSVYALNATSGALIWSYKTGGEVESSPAVANGAVYIGSDDGKVYAFNARSGGLLWSFTTGGEVYPAPAYANGVVYAGSSDDNEYALNPHTGAELWATNTGNIVSSSIVANGVVYLTSRTGTLYALNAANGSILVTLELGYSFFGTPAVSNGVVFLNGYAGNSYALAPQTGINNAKPAAPRPSSLHPDMRLVATR